MTRVTFSEHRHHGSHGIHDDRHEDQVDFGDDGHRGPHLIHLGTDVTVELGGNLADFNLGTDVTVVFGGRLADFIAPGNISAGVSGEPLADGPNLIFGGSGNDTIVGGDRSNVIFAGPGNDFVAGGFGDDVIFGGAGNDTLQTTNRFNSGGNDTLFGGPGDDLLFGTIGGQRHSMFGGTGNDTLIGGDLELSATKDFLSGGPGNDLLNGMNGSDTLLGGAGHDTFQLSPGISGPNLISGSRPGEGNRDVILDFHAKQDLIDLSGYDHVGAGTGHPVFLDTHPFGGSSELQVRYVIEHGHTIVQFQTEGTVARPEGALQGEIDVVGVHHLHASDFLL